MTEEEFLSALPDPGEPERTIVLPDYAAHQLAMQMWGMRLVEGGAIGTVTPKGLVRTFKGRLTHNGKLRLGEIKEGLPA